MNEAWPRERDAECVMSLFLPCASRRGIAAARAAGRLGIADISGGSARPGRYECG